VAKIDSTITQIHTDALSDGVEMNKMKTPGGWLVWLHDTSTQVPTSPCFVLDPKHEWNPSTTDDD